MRRGVHYIFIMKRLFRKFVVKTDGVHRGEAGGVAVYSAFFAVFAIGVGALALDVGPMTILPSQMQDRADTGAMAGAVQLDGPIPLDIAVAGATSIAITIPDAATLSTETVPPPPPPEAPLTDASAA